MYAKYMEHILEELCSPTEKALQIQEDKFFIAAVEANNEECDRNIVLHYPGGYLEQVFPPYFTKWSTMNVPGDMLAKLYAIRKEKKKHEATKKVIQGFLRRAFLKSQTPGDIPALIPETLHIHFPSRLEKKIYNSAQILNKWAIEKFIHEEQKGIKAIRRQLLENVILRS